MIQIKHRYTGEVLFECEATSRKIAVELAVSKKVILGGANLSGAYLSDANLRGAYLGGAYLSDANLRGANLRCANLRDANLRGADLTGAYLSDANLRGADLRGANLTGAKYGDIGITRVPLQIMGTTWDILILDSHMRIGCEFHSLDDWFGFDDETINKMDRGALKWWRKWKEPLKQICIADGRYSE